MADVGKVLLPKIGVSPDCAACGRKVYLMEQVWALKKCYHKTCFKCSGCQKSLSLGNYQELDGSIICNACKNRVRRSNTFTGGMVDHRSKYLNGGLERKQKSVSQDEQKGTHKIVFLQRQKKHSVEHPTDSFSIKEEPEKTLPQPQPSVDTSVQENSNYVGKLPPKTEEVPQNAATPEDEHHNNSGSGGSFNDSGDSSEVEIGLISVTSPHPLRSAAQAQRSTLGPGEGEPDRFDFNDQNTETAIERQVSDERRTHKRSPSKVLDEVEGFHEDIASAVQEELSQRLRKSEVFGRNAGIDEVDNSHESKAFLAPPPFEFSNQESSDQKLVDQTAEKPEARSDELIQELRGVLEKRNSQKADDEGEKAEKDVDTVCMQLPLNISSVVITRGGSTTVVDLEREAIISFN